MKIEIRLPHLDDSKHEVKIIKWLKECGNKVREGEPLLRVSIDQVESEIQSPCNGTLIAIHYKAAQDVAVKAVLAHLEAEREAKVTAISTGHREKKSHPLPVPGAEVRFEDNEDETAEEVEIYPREDEDPRFFSPLVKTLAIKYGVGDDELEKIAAHALGGKITKEDLLRYIDSGCVVSPKPTSSPTRPIPGTSATETHAKASRLHMLETASGVDIAYPKIEWNEDDIKAVPMDSMRSALAEHMLRSKTSSAHAYSIQEVDMTNAAKWRDLHKGAFEHNEGFKLGFTPLFLEASVQALLRFPYINSSVDGKNIILKKNIDLGCAVSLGTADKGFGLIVPVIKQAQNMDFLELARSLNNLTQRAKDRNLLPDEVSAGSFTVTNPGVFGTLISTPIINQPQVAILSIGAIKKRAEVVMDDMIAIRQMCYITLSYDHRVIDGALSALFLAAIREYLENWSLSRPLH